MITSKGYKILLNNERVNEFKKELMISPLVENPVRFPIFRISSRYLYLPKYYGIAKLGYPDKEFINEQTGISINVSFKTNLRDYQEPICDKIYNHILKYGSGLACLYTGWGKTACALYLISKLKKKTLIIVHTENLLNQWKERITQFLDINIDIDLGIIQGPICNTTDKKIVIGMIQSISMKEYESEVFKDFGFTIYDECHHTPGRVFSRIFYKIGSKYNLGLSATLTRSDGLTKVIKYFIGDIIVNLKLNKLSPKITIKYSNIDPIKEKTMINGKLNIPAMINDLCDDFIRNIFIVNIIKEKYSENRKMLVLTDRRAHCSVLKKLLGNEYSTGLYYGGFKNDALQEANKQRIIFATYSMASEGYDNPELDTLIFASPKSKIEQAVGRILRQENKNEPEVIDIVDGFSIFYNMFCSRKKFYYSKKYLDKNNKNDSSDNYEKERNQDIKFDTCLINE
jgi:superfamily II DNA or RNA helicase